MMPETGRIYQGDCVEIMHSWPDNCVDAVVTDPPYGIRFMGKAWDGADIDRQARKREGQKLAKAKNGRVRTNPRQCKSEAAGTYCLAPEAMRNFQAWTAAWAVEALRVIKPGGHILAFASTRTYHRMACGVEDAGFEIRDMVGWVFGSGFPKSLDVSKAIDKANGDKRPVVGQRTDGVGNTSKSMHKTEGFAKSREKTFDVTSAASAASADWDGWGTALKPANEPIVLARKPLSESTVAANVLRWGTGALNIDSCRITSEDDCARNPSMVKDTAAGFGKGLAMGGRGHESGRWPANVLLDQYAAGMMDAKEPGASRFFYVAKPDSGERNMGLDGERVVTAAEVTGRKPGSAVLNSPRACKTGDGANFHPTVKPINLMVHLIKLVTPQGGVILDPFLGSGTTAIAAESMMVKWVGCELSPEYAAIAEARIAAETAQGKLQGIQESCPLTQILPDKSERRA